MCAHGSSKPLRAKKYTTSGCTNANDSFVNISNRLSGSSFHCSFRLLHNRMAQPIVRLPVILTGELMPFIVIHTLTLFTAVIDAYSVDLETSAAHFELDSRNTATMTDSGESNTHTNQTSPCESCAPLDVYLQGFFHSSKENATLVRIRHGLGKSHSPPKKRTDTRGNERKQPAQRASAQRITPGSRAYGGAVQASP